MTKVVKKSLGRQITLSSELVPFQEIDLFAQQSGFVKKLMVDYGTHVKSGQVMAILEIPELQAQLQEDQAEIKNASTRTIWLGKQFLCFLLERWRASNPRLGPRKTYLGQDQWRVIKRFRQTKVRGFFRGNAAAI